MMDQSATGMMKNDDQEVMTLSEMLEDISDRQLRLQARIDRFDAIKQALADGKWNEALGMLVVCEQYPQARPWTPGIFGLSESIVRMSRGDAQ